MCGDALGDGDDIPELFRQFKMFLACFDLTGYLKITHWPFTQLSTCLVIVNIKSFATYPAPPPAPFPARLPSSTSRLRSYSRRGAATL